MKIIIGVVMKTLTSIRNHKYVYMYVCMYVHPNKCILPKVFVLVDMHYNNILSRGSSTRDSKNFSCVIGKSSGGTGVYRRNNVR